MEKGAACYQHTAAELLVRSYEPIARGGRSDHTRIVLDQEI